MKFDQRRQDRLTRAAMVDFEQAETPQEPKQRKGRVIPIRAANAVGYYTGPPYEIDKGMSSKATYRLQ